MSDNFWYYFLTFQWGKAFAKKELELTPQQKMQKIVNDQTEKLRTGRDALERSGSFVRKLKRGVETLTQDVARLNNRIEDAVKEGDDEKAKQWIVKLEEKEQQLAQEQAKLDQAEKDHLDNLKAIEQHQQAIREVQREAQSLSIGLDMAEAQKASAAFQADLKTGMGGFEDARNAMKDQIRRAKADAEVNTSTSKSLEEEFLEDTSDDSVEARLAQFKSKKEN